MHDIKYGKSVYYKIICFVAHNFKCEYVDLGGSISLRHNVHSESKVFPCIKNQRCFFARCVYMPIGAIRLKGYIAESWGNFTIDTLSDIGDCLGISLLSN